jgi:hypothetical protein
MKITGTGSPTPPDVASEGNASERAGVRGKEFSEKLDRIEQGGQAGQGSQVSTVEAGAATGVDAGSFGGAARAGSTSSVAAIGAELSAGRLTPEAALERVIDGILDRQLGRDASPAIREQVGAALRNALESDPLLAEKLRALSGP